MQVLRDYQTKALEDLRTHIRAGRRRLLLVAPTGSGKTTIAAAMIHGAVARQKRILFLAHRRELIDQCCDRLNGLEVPHGVIMAGDPRYDLSCPVQVASVQTLVRRDVDFTPDIIFIDEAHHARAESYNTILETYPGAITVGLTATPIRSDGRGLGNLFDVMVECPGIDQLIERGYLVSPVTYTQPRQTFDTKGIKRSAGDYNTKDLAARFNKPKLVGNIVTHWQRLAADRQTVVFAINIEHSQEIRAQFASHGIAAEHLDGETPTDVREAILARLANGTTRVVVNVGVLTEGWDCPVVSCVVLARPTMSAGLYLQMAGRVLRTNPGKTDCIVLDHAGCVHQHGLCNTPRVWLLTEDKAVPEAKADTADTIKVCPDCGAVTPRATPICVCGYQFSRREIEIQHDETQALVRADHHLANVLSTDAKRMFYRKKLWATKYERTKSGKPYHWMYPDRCFEQTFGYRTPIGWRSAFLSACAECERRGMKPFVHFGYETVEAIAAEPWSPPNSTPSTAHQKAGSSHATRVV